MNFLDKIGKTGLGVLRVAVPLLGDAAESAGGGPLLKIAGLVMTAEVIGNRATAAGGSMPDKLSLVTPEAVDALLQSTLFAGKNVIDPASLELGTQQIITGIVTALKSVDEKQPQKTQ